MNISKKIIEQIKDEIKIGDTIDLIKAYDEKMHDYIIWNGRYGKVVQVLNDSTSIVRAQSGTDFIIPDFVIRRTRLGGKTTC